MALKFHEVRDLDRHSEMSETVPEGVMGKRGEGSIHGFPSHPFSLTSSTPATFSPRALAEAESSSSGWRALRS